jgi:RHS repeat-associated protein
VKWTYDEVGNRASEVRPAGTTSYAYSSATGLLDFTTAPGSVVTDYSYNNLGQQTVAGATSFTYDGAGRMASSLSGGVSTAVTYDGDGRRLDVTTPSGSSSYFHTDSQGSVRLVTGSTGATRWTYAFEPYGVVRSAVASGSPDANLIGWAGQYGDTGGQVHLRARQYDPAIGAFTAPDPAGATGVSASYVYADANPLTGMDPMGLFGWGDITGAASAVWDTATEVAPVVQSIAGAGALALSVVPGAQPVAAVLGAVALAAGVVTTIDAALGAISVCTGATKGSCGDAIIGTAMAAAFSLPPLGLGRATAGGRQFFRGARAGESPSFLPRLGEFKVDPGTGFVRETHGVSVFDNPGSVASNGFVPHPVNSSTIPDELRVIQRGQNTSHYEIVPRPGANLSPERFAACLSQIQCW